MAATPLNSIAIVGAGALGTYYGARLAQLGKAVHFLLRSDYDHVRAHGLTIESRDGDFSLGPDQIHVHRDPATVGPVDLVLIALKATANDQYEPLVRPLLGDHTSVLTLQNGLGNEERLAELFGAERVLGGLAFVCINRVAPGHVRHTGYGFVKLGEFAGTGGTPGDSPRARAVSEMFNAAKLPCSVLPDLRLGRWEKLVWNVPFNGLGAALDLTTDQLLATTAGEELVAGLMREVVATAAAIGVQLPGDIVRKQIDRTRPMGAYLSSMQIDRRARRPLELEAILGAPLKVAQDSGLDTPLLRHLVRLVGAVNVNT